MSSTTIATSLTVPTGLQANAELARRRGIVLALNVTTWLGMMWIAARILGSWIATCAILVLALQLAG